MAEQNRKTREQIQNRDKAKLLVSQFLDYLSKTDIARDMAWEGRSVIGMAADFLGQIPKGSGFSGFCKLAGKCDKIERLHITEDENSAATVMALLTDSQVEALCVDVALRGRERVFAVDPFNPEQPVTHYWDDRRCADYLKCEVKTFQNRVSDSYKRLEQILGLRQKIAA